MVHTRAYCTYLRTVHTRAHCAYSCTLHIPAYCTYHATNVAGLHVKNNHCAELEISVLVGGYYCTYSRTVHTRAHCAYSCTLSQVPSATGRRPLPRPKSYGFLRFVQPPPATQAASSADEIRSSVRFSLKLALPPRRNRYSGGEIAGAGWATRPCWGGATASPSPLVGEGWGGGREAVARRCSTHRPPPPTPPHKGEGRDFAAPSQRNLARRA